MTEIKKLTPMQDRVLVQIEKEPEKTVGNLVIASIHKSAVQTGIVRGVGPGRTEHGKFVPTVLTLGNRVLFPLLTGTEVPTSNGPMWLMKESEILAVLD